MTGPGDRDYDGPLSALRNNVEDLAVALAIWGARASFFNRRFRRVGWQDAGPGRVRRPGGGRKKLEEHDPQLVPALRELLEASTRGDPMSLITWTTLPVRGVAAELAAAGHPCGKNAVLRMLPAGGFSAQGNSRTVERRQHPDRDAGFRYINQAAKRYLAAGDPVISIDTK